MERVYCEECQGFSFVREGKSVCCGSGISTLFVKSVRMTSPGSKRKKAKKKDKKDILYVQNNRCLYCEMEFGSSYFYKGKRQNRRVNWDHLVPFSYSQNNYSYNYVAACNLCNSIKSNLVFQTVDEARVYIKTQLESRNLGKN